MGIPVEEGIKKTVIIFNAFDIRTNQSCERHLEKDQKGGHWIMVAPKEPAKENWYEDEGLQKKVDTAFIYEKIINRTPKSFLSRQEVKF